MSPSLEIVSPRAVLLDFDGVVADSLQAHLDAWNLAVGQMFGRTLEDPQSIAAYATPTIASILAKRYAGDPSQASDLANLKKRIMLGAEVTVHLFPGVKEMLAVLTDREVPFAIASNAPADFIRKILAQHGVEVEVVIGRADAAKAKPFPDVFWEASNRLRVDPKERGRVLVFEDSLHGLEAAIRAGMVPIGVSTHHSAAELSAKGAKATCHHLSDALSQGLLFRAF